MDSLYLTYLRSYSNLKEKYDIIKKNKNIKKDLKNLLDHVNCIISVLLSCGYDDNINKIKKKFYDLSAEINKMYNGATQENCNQKLSIFLVKK